MWVGKRARGVWVKRTTPVCSLVLCQTLSHLPANCVAYSAVVDKTEGRNFQHISAIFPTKLPFLRRSLPVEDVICMFLLTSSGLYKIFIAAT